MDILKKVLPHAIIRADSWIFSWHSMHKRELRDHFKGLVNEKGIVYLIEKDEDFYFRFTMDGKMVDEIKIGSYVDVVDKNKVLHSGHVKKVLSRNDSKKGCKVLLEENDVIGRVKKIYRKSKTLQDLRIDDDSDSHDITELCDDTVEDEKELEKKK